MARSVFICAHGAGGHKDDRGMLRLAQALAPSGLEIVRFNFPYREAGSGRPDPMPVLKKSIVSMVEKIRSHEKPDHLLIGGRSMGGRAASMLAADGFECDGLMLFAYPLHPAGKPEKLRDAHLPRIRVPVLCLNGTRDALCQRDLMERALLAVKAPWDMHWLDGADHSFHVLKSSGRTDDHVFEEVGIATRQFLDRRL
jgi:predicted alpha/beta-hydrolase family hydrolase